MRLELFPFRYRDPLTGKWVCARYVAKRHEIAERFAEFEITGPPEIREVGPAARYFSPHYNLVPRAHLPVTDPPENEPPHPEDPRDKDPPVKKSPVNDPPVREPPFEDPSALDGPERFLLLVFLRRYVTYCARRRRFAAMNGAARLFANVSQGQGGGRDANWLN